jgi:hypothetical protein
MSDQKFRRDLNRVFDDVAGPTSSNLRDRVRSAVVAAPEARGPYWLAGVAAVALAALVAGALYVAGPLRGSPSQVGRPNPTPPPAVSPVPTVAQSPFQCVQQDYVAKAENPARATPPVAFISAIQTEPSQGGFDRLIIEFANGSPPSAQLSAPFAGNTFTLSPSGMQVTLKGDHGIVITLRQSDLHTQYSGPTDMMTGAPTIVEVRRIQDFEGVVQLALGINGSGCYRVSWLTDPDRLVIDVETAT